jgi:hypothetical protein
MKSTKLTYEEYKDLEGKLIWSYTGDPRASGVNYVSPIEVTERTTDEGAYRKTIILNLAGRELRFVGPWKHVEEKG